MTISQTDINNCVSVLGERATIVSLDLLLIKPAALLAVLQLSLAENLIETL